MSSRSTVPPSALTPAAAPRPAGRSVPDPARRRRRRRRVLGAAAVALLAVGGGTAWAAYEYGPRFGFYLVPPSPQRYADVALDLLADGYDAHGPAWDAAADRVREAAATAQGTGDLHAVLAEATAVAGGKHSSFLTPAEADSSVQEATDAYVAPTVTSQGGVTTVTVPELGSVPADRQQAYADAAAGGIAEAAGRTCGWVVDLRGNTGGTMYPMLSGVAPLLPNGTALTFEPRRGVAMEVTVQDDGAGLAGRTSVQVAEVPKVTGVPVAVLQDDRTASSGEAVLTAFRGLDRVVTFGTDSAGYTSANTVHRLYDGAQIVLTTSRYVDRDGVNLDEQPIAPDHPTDPAAAPGAALAWLAEQGCAAG